MITIDGQPHIVVTVCERCGGLGNFYPPDAAWACPYCDGVGYIVPPEVTEGGFAAELVAKQSESFTPRTYRPDPDAKPIPALHIDYDDCNNADYPNVQFGDGWATLFYDVEGERSTPIDATFKRGQAIIRVKERQ